MTLRIFDLVNDVVIGPPPKPPTTTTPEEPVPDNRPTTWIMRGLPGAGKSWLAKLLAAAEPEDVVIASADDYFIGADGVYRFKAEDISDAHGACRVTAWEAMKAGKNVIIDNTNTQRWEFEDYRQTARAMGYRVVVVDIFDGGLADNELSQRNTHGVPFEVIARMRMRYEHDWLTANPLPPWERNTTGE